jgi:phenylacetate-CoA ligase
MARGEHSPRAVGFPRDWAAIDAAREANFAATMDLVVRGHDRYRELIAQRGLDRTAFRSLADLSNLPATTKREYADAPERYRLRLDDLPDEMQAIWDIMYTTGSTSGRPTPFVSTTFDFYNILLLQRRMLEIRGVGPSDVIANLFPLTTRPHGAFIRVLHAAAAMNIPVVSALPGNPSASFTLGNPLDGVIDVLARSSPTILWGVPSYLRRVLDRARECGVGLPSVRLAFVTGEGLSEAARQDLIARMAEVGALGARVSVSYGMTEIQGGLVECADGSGYHNPLPEQLYFEMVDQDTGAPVPDGQPGLILLSHLHRRGTLLLRYAIGDVTVRTREPCPHCGLTTDRFMATPRRVDDLVKIRGTLVDPARILAVLEAERTLAEFLAVVEKSQPGDDLSMDVLHLRIVLRDGADTSVSARLIEEVKRAVGITPVVDVVPIAALDPASWKAQRFVDLRRPA